MFDKKFHVFSQKIEFTLKERNFLKQFKIFVIKMQKFATKMFFLDVM
jgi:hypothetical protein